MERTHQHPLKEEMGRRQNKRSLSNRNTNMTPPESRDPTPARPEKHYIDEEEETDHKNYFMKMMETLKEETRKSLKEIEEKQTKKSMKWRKKFKK